MKTLIGIKPDAFVPNAPRETGSELRLPLPDPESFIEELRGILQEKWLRILREKRYVTPVEVASEHYAEHRGIIDPIYSCDKHAFLVEFMTSGPSHWIEAEWDEAIAKWREAITEIREKYLQNRKTARTNMTHGSDSPESAEREIRLHFWS